jgi:hypothetical protein
VSGRGRRPRRRGDRVAQPVLWLKATPEGAAEPQAQKAEAVGLADQLAAEVEQDESRNRDGECCEISA